MRILIVKAMKSSGAGELCTRDEICDSRDYFSRFVQIVRRIILFQSEVLDTELEIMERRPEELKPLLYEIESGLTCKENMLAFDMIDFFIVVGDHRYHPWSRESRFVNILIRMCVKADKHLLAASESAFQALVFELNSRIGRNIEIINESGKPLVAAHHAPEEFTGKYFLDSIHGQLYSYSSENGEWSKKLDCGLVNVHFSQDYRNRRTGLTNFKVGKGGLVASKSMNVCRVLEKNSYLTYGVDPRFEAYQMSKWHAKVTDSYNVVVQGQHGPAVIERGRAVGIHFLVTASSPNSVKILENYIIDKLVKSVNDKSDRQRSSDQMNEQYFQRQAALLQYHGSEGSIIRKLNEDRPLPKTSLTLSRSKLTLFEQKPDKDGQQTYPHLSKLDVIRFLHPDLTDKFIEEKPWAPGNLGPERDPDTVLLNPRPRRHYFRRGAIPESKEGYKNPRQVFRVLSKEKWLFDKFS